MKWITDGQATEPLVSPLADAALLQTHERSGQLIALTSWCLEKKDRSHADGDIIRLGVAAGHIPGLNEAGAGVGIDQSKPRQSGVPDRAHKIVCVWPHLRSHKLVLKNGVGLKSHGDVVAVARASALLGEFLVEACDTVLESRLVVRRRDRAFGDLHAAK